MAQHNETGKRGEELAGQHLRQKGYTILAVNWRAGRSEVDMIAHIGNTLVFVEVKTRNTEFFGLPESFVTEKKQQQLSRAAEMYCTKHTNGEMEVRYDIVAVIINKEEEKILHFEDAFFPDNLGLF
jgi:putative endonuclease